MKANFKHFMKTILFLTLVLNIFSACDREGAIERDDEIERDGEVDD